MAGRRSNKRESKRKTRKESGAKRTADVHAPSPIAGPESKEDWEAKSGLRTLHEAHQITSNKGLMQRIRKHAKGEADRASRIARLEGKLL